MQCHNAEYGGGVPAIQNQVQKDKCNGERKNKPVISFLQ